MFSGLYDEIQVLSSTNLSTYYTLISRRLKCLQRKTSLGVLSQDQIDLDGLTKLKKSCDSNQNIEYFETEVPQTEMFYLLRRRFFHCVEMNPLKHNFHSTDFKYCPVFHFVNFETFFLILYIKTVSRNLLNLLVLLKQS